MALLIGPLAYWVTQKLDWIDDPKAASHKKHKSPMPVAGGLVLFTAIVIGSLIFDVYRSPQVMAILLSSAIIFIFGLWYHHSANFSGSCWRRLF
jgi:UDP-N-acetylmuramyl pentapeptide phosphotransferase/UDP-N-acetylglucosamine-1-phosphate transferase